MLMFCLIAVEDPLADLSVGERLERVNSNTSTYAHTQKHSPLEVKESAILQYRTNIPNIVIIYNSNMKLYVFINTCNLY